MEDKFEVLGQLIDDLESLQCGLDIPLPPAMHVEQMKSALTDKVRRLKDIFVEITGENPWD
jgi:hypothetical protein